MVKEEFIQYRNKLFNRADGYPAFHVYMTNIILKSDKKTFEIDFNKDKFSFINDDFLIIESNWFY